MSMNIERHIKAHQELYQNLVNGELRQGGRRRRHSTTSISRCSTSPPSFIWKPCGWCSRNTRCRSGRSSIAATGSIRSAIRKTTLFTVEGERDDICAVGQTVAAHELCSSLRPYRKRHHMQAGVGHYGVFSGKRWDGPDLSDFEKRDLVERLSCRVG